MMSRPKSRNPLTTRNPASDGPADLLGSCRGAARCPAAHCRRHRGARGGLLRGHAPHVRLGHHGPVPSRLPALRAARARDVRGLAGQHTAGVAVFHPHDRLALYGAGHGVSRRALHAVGVRGARAL